MKIAVSSVGNSLEAQVDPRFGRCAFFLIVDPEKMTYEVFDNGDVAQGGGAGIQAARFIASKGAEKVITGNCGPNAVRTLNAAGIDVIMGQEGTVRDAIERCKRGELSASKEPNVSEHHGMSGEMGVGRRGGGGA
jgi:predicted Fe-Mo cluster-binding NifX family protein